MSIEYRARPTNVIADSSGSGSSAINITRINVTRMRSVEFSDGFFEALARAGHLRAPEIAYDEDDEL